MLLGDMQYDEYDSAMVLWITYLQDFDLVQKTHINKGYSYLEIYNSYCAIRFFNSNLIEK